MTSKKIKTQDILGKNYYTYNLSSSNYNPSLNTNITVTCVVKNVYGNVIPNKSLQLKQNGTNVGNSVSTNSNGVATWTVTCSNGGLQEFSVEDNLLEVFVDNKADANHTHNNYLTSHQDISGKEDKNNKSSSITSDTGSTTKYPTVKAVEDYAEPKKEVGTFTELQSLINNASNGDTIVLDKDYVNSENLTGTLTINNNKQIDGNNHIIDFNNASFSLAFSSGCGITQCTIIKAYQLQLNGNQSFITNCIFKNCTLQAPIITMTAKNTFISNCTFYNNNHQFTSLIMATAGAHKYIEKCLFFNNIVGSCISVSHNEKSHTYIDSCEFINNTTQSGTIASDNVNNNIYSNCIFNNNTASLSNKGGAFTLTKSSTISPKLTNNIFLTTNDTITPDTIVNQNYLTEYQDITDKEDKSNKSSSITTDTGSTTKYPTVKAVEDYAQPIGNYLTSHQDITGKVNTSDLVGTFTELQELIANASNGDTIVLEKNYKNTDNVNILLNKSLTIIGNGHIIDGNKQSKNFTITGDSSVSYNIENVIFTNFTQGNAIQGYPQNTPVLNNHTLNIQYCTFINNKNGIWYTRNVSDKNISNCVFINHSTYAISIVTPLTTINCTFINSPINSTYVTNKNYLTDHQSITGKEDSSNKVTSLSSSSTDTQYPSAKVVYDSLSNKADSSSLDTLTATVTYTDSSTDTVTFYIVPSQDNSS